MSLVIPDAEVWLCSNIPFDMNYENTMLFSTTTEQFQTISSKALQVVSNCMYIRKTGRLRLEVGFAVATRINYLIYKNTSFEGKYFYAFVTNCYYINNNTAEFSFVEDVMQTWMFEVSLKDSYVEREHIANDTMYASLTEENIEMGEVYVHSQFQDKFSRTFKICVTTSFVRNAGEDDETGTYTLPEGKIYGKTYSGLHNEYFDSADAANFYIQQINNEGRIDGVISITMIPDTYQAGKIVENVTAIIPFNSSSEEVDTTNRIAKKESSTYMFGGYTPKNKKLYNYPYRYVKVLNGRGSAGIYRWEFNASDLGTGSAAWMYFQEFVGGYANPEILLVPYGYETISTSINPAHVLTTTGSMPCSWTNDAYQAWKAQNANQIDYANTARALNLAKGVVSTVTGTPMYQSNYMDTTYNQLVGEWNAVASPGTQMSYQTNPTAAGNAATTLLNWYGEVKKLQSIERDHEILPPESQVVSSSGQLAFDAGITGYTFQCCSIRKEYAQIIDNYFTKYGYACNKVKTPNLHTRTSFNYIKTVGCMLSGTAPADAMQAIRNVYNKGVTFWHTSLENVGNYSLSNGSY